MPRLQDLNLAPEQVEAAPALEELPEQFGTRTEPLQPGIYRFQLPDDMADVWNEMKQVDIKFKDAAGVEHTKQVDRVCAIFDADHPLQIVQSPQDERNGEAFNWRINNVERFRDKAHTQRAAEMDYLLRALGEVAHPGWGNNQGYGVNLSKYAGKQFTAEVQMSYYSNPKREIYGEFDVEGGGKTVQEVPGVYGNGSRLYQNQVTRDGGKYPATIPVQITVTDPANAEQQLTYTQIVRGFNDLTGLRA